LLAEDYSVSYLPLGYQVGPCFGICILCLLQLVLLWCSVTCTQMFEHYSSSKL